MSWLLFSPKVPRDVLIDRIATDTEMQNTFEQEHDNLRWISLVVTGDEPTATKAIVDATVLHRTRSGVFYDWLARWAHSATARVAALSVKDRITTDATSYLAYNCGHSDHELLSDSQVSALKQVDPEEIIVNLDFLARAVLVLRGIQRASISDCSILLEVPRRTVVGAYCRALKWLSERPESDTTGNNSSIGRGEAP